MLRWTWNELRLQFLDFRKIMPQNYATKSGEALQIKAFQGRPVGSSSTAGKMRDQSNLQRHERFMRAALAQAKKAAALQETPVGCVIVQDGKIIARGYNRRNTEGNTLAHAELGAIRKACRKVGDWRLEGCTMYVTLEPCPMCAGALVQSRMEHVVLGARNPKAGCAGSVLDLLQQEGLNHQVRVTDGVLETECRTLLQDFFRQLRIQKAKKQ